MSERTVYVGTYTRRDSEGIYIYKFDDESGALSQVDVVPGQEEPSFLTLHPNGRYLYAVNEYGSDGQVNSFAIDRASGGLTFINRQPTHGAAPCHLAIEPTGKTLVVANYTSGNVAVYPLNDDGSIGDPVQNIQHEGSGPNQARQEGPHAHSATISPDGSRVYVADLGMDKVMIYRIVDGKLAANDPPSVSVHPGGGPRHFDFHPNGRFAYIINELDSTATACSYDPASGALTPIQTVSTLPAGFDGNNSCADVHVSADGRFLYGSNRGHDSIAIFAIDTGTGMLTPAGHASTRGRVPRNFTLDPTGNWLLAANQETDDISVFRRDTNSGQLSPVGDPVSAPMPVCLRFGP